MNDIYDKFSDKDAIERLRRQRREEDLRNVIERIIDEAAEKGAFDNLPGKGQPLKLKKNPYASDQSLAYELLQNNDYTLPWIEKRNEILDKAATLRKALSTDWARAQQRWQEADPLTQSERQVEWVEQLRDYAARVVALNEEISRANLAIPVSQLELLKLTLDEELKRAGVSRVLGA